MSLNEKLLRESFHEAVEREGLVTTRFYELLFERYPQVKPLFGRKSTAEQQKMLQETLLAVLDHLDEGEWLTETLGGMGRVHVSYEVTPEMYPWVGECLIAALAEGAKDCWSPAHAEAWEEAYGVLAGLMLAGAEAELAEASSTSIAPTATLASLAVERAGASRVFHRHRLDFCCHGEVSLEAACETRGLDVNDLIAEIQAEDAPDSRRWDEAPIPELIEHILNDFHTPHREELGRLLGMARRVEAVHGAKASCPKGLADTIAEVEQELLNHMAKEEQVLFPHVLAGHRPVVPIQVLEQEHLEHAENLERLRAHAHDYDPPAEACGTWRALYLGLAQLERELMEHIHLENHVLFPRVLERRPQPV
ncbi:MAG: iron-sulfur cluster repair di-iron protein [Planctomycetes bacterium]|nr:iron-sulfur cluster repair di-iron protein [Planctomycetota bacterium]